ncbi:MAG: RusA family crossover junction endodeoxyribonuclease [Mariprofundaceae bacterium]|nr:RusA family crossover junction endodeoxyribonuclease [Mariprofundaceae bacterium]
MSVCRFVLPYPPSLNRYYRNVKGRTLISAQGRAYRHEVVALLHKYRGRYAKELRLSIDIVAYMPDRRRRDLDNLFKGLFDAIEHSGMIDDDSQFDHVRIRRDEVVKGGRVDVEIGVV